MRDVDVGPRYPGFVRRDFAALDWNGAAKVQVPVVSFQVPEAIVTKAYLVIDPARGELFIDQTRNGILDMPWLITPPLTEGGFSLVTNKIHRVRGRTAVIGGPIEGSYYHWLLSWCPRLLLLKMLVPEIHDDPKVRFLIDIRAKGEPFISFLKALAIPPERIVWADCSTAEYQLEQAVLVSMVPDFMVLPDLQRAMSEAFRSDAGLPRRSGRRRRIWISRQELPAPRRRVANMEAVSPVLARFGFEELVLERMRLEEQLRAFAEAEIVLGVHGAGLANMIFCQKDCRIAVIEAKGSIAAGTDRFFSILAAACGLAYQAMPADPQVVDGTDRSDFWQSHFEDLEVDPAALSALIESMGITSVV